MLKVHCPPEYPDVLPDLNINTSHGEISTAEEESLLSALYEVVRNAISRLGTFYCDIVLIPRV